MSQFELYLQLGWQHILDLKGYDHILYILALAVAYSFKEWKMVLVLVTAFTLGHSVTLALSALDVITASTEIIEFLIPVTIALTALFNVVKFKDVLEPGMRRLRYASALFFGLIHGMGFSFYLKSLLGQEDSIVLPLFAFNVGLELGQIVIVLGILILQFLACKLLGLKRNWWVLITSLAVLGFTIPILIDSWAW